MKLEIRFRHMDRSEALEDFVTEKITQSLEPVLHRHDAHIQVWLISDRNLSHRAMGWFVCEIDIRYAPRKEVFVHKSGADMHGAILEAVDKAHAQIDETGKRESDRRRHNHGAPPTDLYSPGSDMTDVSIDLAEDDLAAELGSDLTSASATEEQPRRGSGL